MEEEEDQGGEEEEEEEEEVEEEEDEEDEEELASRAWSTFLSFTMTSTQGANDSRSFLKVGNPK